MATQFTFVANDQRIEIRAVIRHANGLESIIDLSIGAFSGSFKTEFATAELINLHERLVSTLAAPSGIIAFRSANGDLSLTIEFVNAKEAQLSGMMQPHLLPQVKLEFRLDGAAASLGRTVQELEDVIREFGLEPQVRYPKWRLI